MLSSMPVQMLLDSPPGCGAHSEWDRMLLLDLDLDLLPQLGQDDLTHELQCFGDAMLERMHPHPADLAIMPETRPAPDAQEAPCANAPHDPCAPPLSLAHDPCAPPLSLAHDPCAPPLSLAHDHRAAAVVQKEALRKRNNRVSAHNSRQRVREASELLARTVAEQKRQLDALTTQAEPADAPASLLEQRVAELLSRNRELEDALARMSERQEALEQAARGAREQYEEGLLLLQIQALRAPEEPEDARQGRACKRSAARLYGSLYP